MPERESRKQQQCAQHGQGPHRYGAVGVGVPPHVVHGRVVHRQQLDHAHAWSSRSKQLHSGLLHASRLSSSSLIAVLAMQQQ